MRIAGQNPTPFEIIGVVAHQRHSTLTTDGREAVFFLDGQRGFGVSNRFILRTDQDPVDLIDAAKAAVARVDWAVGLADIQPMSILVDRAQAPTWFALVLTSVFAAIAAILAAVGLYACCPRSSISAPRKSASVWLLARSARRSSDSSSAAA